MKVKLLVDKIRISGPRIDGSYTISLEVGEYEKGNLARLLILPEGVYEVEITPQRN